MHKEERSHRETFRGWGRAVRLYRLLDRKKDRLGSRRRWSVETAYSAFKRAFREF